MAWNEIIENHKKILDLFRQEEFYKNILDISNRIVERLKNGGTLYIAGNGGSAADAQHIAAELIGRFEKNRQPISAVALTTDTSLLTAISNDYDFSEVFKRQVQALVKPEDIFLGISTSGNSPNIVKAFEALKNKKCYKIALLGRDGGEILRKNLADDYIVVPLKKTRYIQEAHIIIYHEICEIIENEFLTL